MPNRKVLTLTLSALAIEGILSLGLLLSIPGDPKNALWFGFSLPRLLLAASLLGGSLFFVVLAWQSVSGGRVGERLHLWAARISQSGLAFGVALVSFSTAAIVLLNWRFLPPNYEALAQRAFPALLYATLILAHLLVLTLWDPRGRGLGRMLLAALTLILAIFYLAGTLNFSAQNNKFEISDQAAYIEFAREVKRSAFQFTGSRNFMPLYPYLQAVLLDPGQDNAALFELGKQVNILVSLGLLVALFLIFRKHLRPLSAYLLTLIVAFSLYVYKAAHYQPELLFYFLFFLVFLLMGRLIQQANWKTAILLGLVAGLAHLTKASVLPALLLFTGAYLLMIVRARFTRNAGRRLLNLALVLAIFLLTVLPYILESKQRYGQYFYNVNTTFYVWYDSWREAKEGTRAHGDAVGWPQIPADQIPSLQKYLGEHSAADILKRLGDGLAHQALNLWKTFSLISYPLIYLTALLILLLLGGARTGALLREHFGLIAFVLAFIGGYLLLFAWYGPIADYSDLRFTYGLYIPILFSIFLALEKLLAGDESYQISLGRASGPAWANALHGAIALILTYELIFQIPEKLNRFDWYGK